MRSPAGVGQVTPLWPHQTRAIDLAREAMATHQRVVIQLPTGGGKTRVGTEIVSRGIARGRRWLWLAHRTELVDQAYDTLTDAGLSPGCIASSSSRPAHADSPVQVASIQTLLARDTNVDFDAIVADECHHLGEGAETWSALLTRFPRARVIGLTATPERGDGTGLSPMFTALVQPVSIRELTESGVLVPCEVERPSTFLRQKIKTGNPLAQPPVDAWISLAGQRQGFLFARSVAEAAEYAEQLCARGVVARMVCGQTPAADREAILGGFRAGRVRCIANVYVMTEGVDLPSADVCMLASYVGTAGGFLQRVGRILRRAPGKTGARLIDLPGLTHLYGAPEDERVWSLDGRAARLAGQSCQVCRAELTDGYPCPACGYSPDGGSRDDEQATSILNEPLQKFARMIAQGPVQRRETFDRWVAIAKIKGHKIGSVRHKWRAVYGEDPPVEWMASASPSLA